MIENPAGSGATAFAGAKIRHLPTMNDNRKI
jgi:hypothetical protein